MQALLLVRDEYYTPAVRFLRETGVEPDPARNVALVDLFEVDHARRVLVTLGRSLGQLPRLDEELSEDQHGFLDRVLGLLRLNEAFRRQSAPAVRQAILLVLGGGEQLADVPVEEFRAELERSYLEDADSGVHGAIDWVLRRAGQGELLDEWNRRLESAGWDGIKGWYHTPSGHFMVVIRGPVEFRMGAPESEPGYQRQEALRPVRIERTYAIAAKEITEAEFRRCSPQVDPKTITDRPFNDSVFWNFAAVYCNWVTDQEGLPLSELVYRPLLNAKGEALRVAVERTGYRLPTEEEWEYACRAGSVTSRFFGETESAMDEYAWSFNNASQSPRPVGLLKPNRFGLFDMLGNVSEWCHGTVDEDGKDLAFAFRGGSAWSSPIQLRAAARYHFRYDYTNPRVGFRLARTLPEPAEL